MGSLIYTVTTAIVTALLARPQAPSQNAYVGFRTCATCHSSIGQMQPDSRHALTWRAPGKEFPETYKVELDGHEPLLFPVRVVLGGDRFGFSFILEMDRIAEASLPRKTLVEGRFMHSSRTGRRTLSPGLPVETPVSYVTAAGRVLSPTFADKCLTCHGAPSEVFRDTGVRCERCHGPGQRHVEAVGQKAKNLQIVNPGKLASEQYLAVCGQCHSGFSPLTDPRPDDLLISSQVTSLRNSACYIKSGQRLTCASCHDPHNNARREDPKYEQACLSCHSAAQPQSKPCKVEKKSGCVACHMPEVRRTDSFPLIDHWIRVVERPLPENIRARVSRGVSIAEKGDKSQAVKFFEGLLAAGAAEPSLHYNLGLAYEDIGRSEDALKSYNRAIQLEPDMVAAYINVGSLLLARKQVDEAIASFQKAIEINPLEVTAHYNLAIANQMKGNSQAMQRELRLVVAIDPRMKKVLTPP